MFAAWALPIGLVCGIGQYFLTKHIANSICKGRQRPLVTGLLIGGKFLFTLGVCTGMAFISVYHMLWTAGGILSMTIAGAIFDFVKVRVQKIR